MAGVRIGIAIAMLVLAGCSSGGKMAAQTDAKTASRIERCTQRFLDRIDGDGGPAGGGLRSYVERTYCGPFARKGWVYADGTLSIKAPRPHEWWFLRSIDAGSRTACYDDPLRPSRRTAESA